MRVIPYKQFPADELVFGLVIDAAAGKVEKRARIKTKMPISTKGRLLDECGGSEIQAAFFGAMDGSCEMAEANSQIEKLRPRYENEFMFSILEAIGDNVSPHRQIAMRLTTVDRDLLNIRQLILRHPIYHYSLPCSASGPGRCVDAAKKPSRLRGQVDLRENLTVRVPSDDEVFIEAGRFATFDSAPADGIESLKRCFVNCDEEERSKEGKRADSTHLPHTFLFGQTIIDHNGRRLTEEDANALDEDEFSALRRLVERDEKRFGVDTILRIVCPRCKGENKVDFFSLLCSLCGIGRLPMPGEEKPSS